MKDHILKKLKKCTTKAKISWLYTNSYTLLATACILIKGANEMRNVRLGLFYARARAYYTIHSVLKRNSYRILNKLVKFINNQKQQQENLEKIRVCVQ